MDGWTGLAGQREHWLPTMVPAHEWHPMNLEFALLVLPWGTTTWDWLLSPQWDCLQQPESVRVAREGVGMSC